MVFIWRRSIIQCWITGRNFGRDAYVRNNTHRKHYVHGTGSYLKIVSCLVDQIVPTCSGKTNIHRLLHRSAQLVPISGQLYDKEPVQAQGPLLHCVTFQICYGESCSRKAKRPHRSITTCRFSTDSYSIHSQTFYISEGHLLRMEYILRYSIYPKVISSICN
jgi:hypothetical protein